jgi:EAL and modified HD-GYP domain-containing signal transduction protein
MANWLQRVLGRGDALPPAERERPPDRGGQGGRREPSAAAPAAAAQVPSAASAAAPGAAAAMRRPLLESSGAVAGFEFMLPPLALQRLASGDAAQAAAHLVALLAGIRQSQAGADTRPRIALLSAPAHLLARPAVREALPAGLWLALPTAQFSGELARSLLEQQVLAGVEDVPQRGAAFVRIDAATLPAPWALPAAIGACRAAAATTRIVVTGLPSAEGIEAALSAGADLAGGAHDVVLDAAPAAPLPAAMLTVARLMHLLQTDAELADIAPALRADVALAYTLLRHANSPLLGLRRKVDSVEQAVMLLGRAPLYRWLCLRLLAAAPPRRAAHALFEVALARAGFAEALAPRGKLDAGAAYTAGLLSLLDVMLATPMAAAVAPLNLGDELNAALVRRHGALAAPLLLAASLERGDAVRAAALGELFGGIDAVLPLHEQAWAQAAALADQAASEAAAAP